MEDHRLARLGEMAHVFSGLALSGRSVAGRGSLVLPALSVGDVTDGRVNIDSLGTVTVESQDDAARYEGHAGDVLIAARGTAIKSAILPQEVAGSILTSTVIGVRLDRRLLPEVLIAFLHSRQGQEALRAQVRSATGQIALSARDVAAITVPVPPMAVQHRVAELVQAADQQARTAIAAATLRRDVAYALAGRALASEKGDFRYDE